MHKLVTNFPTFHMHVFVMLTQHGQQRDLSMKLMLVWNVIYAYLANIALNKTSINLDLYEAFHTKIFQITLGTTTIILKLHILKREQLTYMINVTVHQFTVCYTAFLMPLLRVTPQTD